MDHTSLDLCLRINCLNSFFKTRKTIHAEEKDIFYSAVLEIIKHPKPELAGFICAYCDAEDIFLSRVPLDMSFVFGIQSYLKNTAQEKLFYQRRTPRMKPQLDDKSPLIPQILKKDVLLSYPFENIKSFINLLEESAKDESVVSIKMTLYRLADKSQIVDALVEAVEVAAPVLDEKLKERLDWMFATMMNDDEKGKRLTETGNYADRNLNDVRLNSQEIFYAMAYSNAEKMQKKEKSEK